MNRSQIVLAALAAGGQNAGFKPVQVQKLFFLLDREGKHLLNGPHFDFRPYDYGPFDREVYDEIDALEAQGLVEVLSSGRYRMYILSQSGLEEGQKTLTEMTENARTYVSQVAKWVRELSFEQLVAAIYKRYPDMKVNSVFRQ